MWMHSAHNGWIEAGTNCHNICRIWRCKSAKFTFSKSKGTHRTVSISFSLSLSRTILYPVYKFLARKKNRLWRLLMVCLLIDRCSSSLFILTERCSLVRFSVFAFLFGIFCRSFIAICCIVLTTGECSMWLDDRWFCLIFFCLFCFVSMCLPCYIAMNFSILHIKTIGRVHTYTVTQ